MGVAFIPKCKSNCRNIGKKVRPDADNDGCAIFWRASRFTASKIDFIAFDDAKRNEGAVRVELCSTSPQPHQACERLTVIAAHLTSGDKPSDEIKRMKEVRKRVPHATPCESCLRHALRLVLAPH